MNGKIKLGISSCLLGNSVRYDGGHKLDRFLLGTLSPLVEWVPVCPEVECGLPVPREAMQLVGGRESVRLVAIESGIDQTETLMRWVRAKLEDPEVRSLCGFVFKARSPSCGVHDAAIIMPGAGGAVQGPGLFARAVLRQYAGLPIEDEERLRDQAVRKAFIDAISARHRMAN